MIVGGGFPGDQIPPALGVGLAGSSEGRVGCNSLPAEPSQDGGGGSPVAGRAAWRPESGRAGCQWCGPRDGKRPRRAEGEPEWGLTDWRGDDSEESRARERGRAGLGAKGAATFCSGANIARSVGVEGVNNQRVPTAPGPGDRKAGVDIEAVEGSWRPLPVRIRGRSSED